MVTKLEKLGVKKRDYNGLSVFEIAKAPMPVVATVSYGETKRLKFEGTFCIDRTEGSYRYPQEVQFVLWTRDLPLHESRSRHDGYSRIEIAIPRNVAIKLLELALRKLWLLPDEGA